MLYLNSEKLEQILREKKLSLSSLAKGAGVSRQSLYSMFSKNSVFNSTFCKILGYLKVDYQVLTYEMTPSHQIMSKAPTPIKKISLQLIEFCKRYHANLILFGSRAEGKTGVQVDWDFGIFFLKSVHDREFKLLKVRLTDAAFPYRIDIVNLNEAPAWFLESLQNRSLILHGKEFLGGLLRGRAA